MRVPDEKLIDRFPNNAALRTIQANPEKVIFMLRYLLAAEPYPMGAPDTVHALEQDYKLSPEHAKYRRNQAARLLEEGMIIEIEGRTRSALYRLTPFGKRLAEELIKAHGNLPPPDQSGPDADERGMYLEKARRVRQEKRRLRNKLPKPPVSAAEGNKEDK